MNTLINPVIAGVSTFAATNIDDIIVLMLFFSQKRARTRHIIIGQYLGFAVLIAASLPGFFGGMLLPKEWIGLLGLLPITIGIRQFWQSEETEPQLQNVSLPSALTKLFNPQIFPCCCCHNC